MSHEHRDHESEETNLNPVYGVVDSVEEEVMDFSDDVVKPVKVLIGDGVYYMEEPSGEAVIRYRSEVAKCYKYNAQGGISSVVGLPDTEPLLVSLCLRDENGKLVPTAKVRQFKYRTQRALFEKARKMANLNLEEDTIESLEKRIEELKKEQDALKNEQSDNEDGST